MSEKEPTGWTGDGTYEMWPDGRMNRVDPLNFSASPALAGEEKERKAWIAGRDAAAVLADNYERDGRDYKEYAAETADEIAARIRNLEPPAALASRAPVSGDERKTSIDRHLKEIGTLRNSFVTSETLLETERAIAGHTEAIRRLMEPEEITALRAEVERLKKALEPFAQDMFDDDSWLPNDEVSVYADDYLLFRVTVSDFRNARAAMDKKDAQGAD